MEKERKVWSGNDENQCVALCKTFREEGVGFRVEQHAYTVSKREVDRYFAIWVPLDFYDDAKAVVDETTAAETDPVDGDDESNALPEAPAGARDVVAGGDKTRANLNDDGEAPAVEVFSGATKEDVEYVVLCLTGVDIECRVTVNGAAKVFVAACDERAAREIVREVLEGSPPD